MTLLMQVIKSDSVGDRGERTIQDGDMGLLLDFQFNREQSLGDAIRLTITTVFDRDNSQVTVTIPDFVPINDVLAPPETSFFRLVTVTASLDFVANSFEAIQMASAEIPFQSASQPSISLTWILPAPGILPVVTVLGIEFYQQVNTRKYLLQNVNYHALNITQVSTVL